MDIYHLGGAGEVGRSCVVIETGGKCLMIDCGIKVKGDDENRYPLFDRIKELPPVEAVIITHAHMDHCGAVPVAAKLYPQARIYLTEATADIAYVMLQDNAKLMEEKEEEIPAYNYDDIEMTINRTKKLFFCKYETLWKGVRFTFLQAGHVLGAAAVLLETAEGKVLYTGDYTTFRQELVNPQSFSGYIRNRGIKIDLMITEGTYGNSQHPERAIEEDRLKNDVMETIKKGGKVLIPSFALGRSQEVIVLLKRMFEETGLDCSLYVDGMIRYINCLYHLNYKYLPAKYRMKAEKNNDLFTGGRVINVNNAIRRKIVKQEQPCIIVSSSGMLTGGASVTYAMEMIKDPRNMIAIVGYQDEESPGGKLISGGNGDIPPQVEINGQTYDVLCSVNQYSLSAHADQNGIINTVMQINPRELHLVHGEREALIGLKSKLDESIENAVVWVVKPTK